ncbi:MULTISPECIES: FGGY-family carbohydrate kinase [Streptomyces]|uniref:FGGY-family carbohydrate kinase n=1 Tax=Streptomyces mutomycini TaxID=284036 RepID=A0ABW0B2J8_9ACTN|nr:MULTISPECIES: FGGY family carbohydrate kinase [Streptomyces]KPC81854.1 carbohydrate kinase [Streptomyces sp. NRRL S-4]
MTGAAPDVWLGIDLGTQGVRAVAVTSDGRLLGTGSSPLTSHRRGERHEQDPQQWWSAVCSAVGQTCAAGADPRRIRAVAVDATSGTVTLTDRHGRCVTPGLMYDDGRATVEAEQVNALGEEQWAKAGYRRMQRSWGLPKLRWMLDRYPHAVADGWRLAHQNDVINRRLVGHDVPTDTSNALKSGADAATVTWPEQVFAELAIPTGVLPGLVVPGTVVGEVCAGAAAECGLVPGIPVVAGMTDGCAAQLGSGATAVGSWNSVLGTTLVLKGVTEDLLHDPSGIVYSHRSPSGHWLPGGASSTGAGLVAREFAGAGLDRLTDEAAPLLPTGLLRYPLVSPGERFPFVAPDAVAFSSREPAGRAEDFAALMQGVAYLERLCFDYLDLLGAPTDGTVVLTGGATRNPVWNQLRADVLRRPLSLPLHAQPALGMAVLAASSCGGAGGLDRAAAAIVRPGRVLEPRSVHRSAHQEGYARLLDLLVQRGWLSETVSAHARERTAP